MAKAVVGEPIADIQGGGVRVAQKITRVADL